MNTAYAAAEPTAASGVMASLASAQAIIGVVLGVDVPVLAGAIVGSLVGQSYVTSSLPAAVRDWFAWTAVAAISAPLLAAVLGWLVHHDVPVLGQAGLSILVGIFGRNGVKMAPRCARLIFLRWIRDGKRGEK